MARILAIDYGQKRTGIAVSDPFKIIASPLTTIATHQLVYFLKNYFQEETVELVILGYPTHADGTDMEITAKIKKFFQQFQRIFPLTPIILEDESYTSKMAFQSMIEGGIKKKKRQDKSLIDKISAAILLQGYMERKR